VFNEEGSLEDLIKNLKASGGEDIGLWKPNIGVALVSQKTKPWKTEKDDACGTEKKTCWKVSGTVTIKYKIIVRGAIELPKWAKLKEQSAAVQAIWADLLATVKTHEEGHEKVTRDLAKAWNADPSKTTKSHDFKDICIKVYKATTLRGFWATDQKAIADAFSTANDTAQDAYHVRVGAKLKIGPFLKRFKKELGK
jgi:predicted secreted Zn-dependent protease